MLTIEDDAACEIVVEDEEGAYPCGIESRFVVERSDEDIAYSPLETCADHLADALFGMADGDTEVPLIVTIRWDDSPEPETEAQRLARVMTP